jgi:hypothetical protein
MANDKDSLKIKQDIATLQQAIARQEANTNELIEIRNQKIRAYKKEILVLARELKKVNQQSLDAYGSAEQSIGSISGIYKNLQESQQKSLKLQQDSFAEGSQQEKSAFKIASINRQISDLSASDVQQKAALLSLRNDEMAAISKGLDANSAVLKNLEEQNKIAINNSNLSEDEIEALKKQVTAQEALKSSMQAITETAQTFVSRLSSAEGITGLLLIGSGKFFGKLSEVNAELGQVGEGLSGAAGSATLLSFAFGDSATTLKALSAEMGGLEDATFGAQLQTSIMANNMGITGTEAATLSGSLSRLNDGSLETAGNLADGTREFARMNNIPVSQLMGDVAGATEEFALFGKDGGKNILQAAGYAAKLGTNMSTISGIADGLLDFESSITKELELGAMLGKNINLDKARQLAMEGDLEGMMKETLSSLGGIDAFNKMDYFQKKATAYLLGVSVTELGKMATNQEKAQKVSKLMSGDFSNIGESLKALVSQAGPKLLDWGGKFLTLSAQAGQSWTGITTVLGGIREKFKGLGGGATDAASSISGPLTKAGKPDMRFNSNKGGVSDMLKGKSNPAGKGGMMDSMSKINMNAVLKGAAAMVIVAASVFVFGKAVQEFMKVSWKAVGMAVVSMLALVGAVSLLGAIMMSGVGAVAILAGAAAMLVIASSVLVLGIALQQIGTGFEMLSSGIGTLMPQLLSISTVIGGLVLLIPAIGLLSLSLMGLSASLVALGVAGILASPGLLALSVVGTVTSGLNSLMGGGDSKSSNDEIPAWVEELKTTFRETKDVYMDGTKVTSVIKSKVSKVGSNTYAI